MVSEDDGKYSQVVIEELMLLTSSMLPYFKDQLLKKSESLLLDLQPLVQEPVPDLAKELSQPDEGFFPIEADIDEEQKLADEALERQLAAEKEQLMQLMASGRAKNFLDRFFKDFGVTFKTASRQEIESSFNEAKGFKAESELFRQYIESQYAKSYQHFANIVKKTLEETKFDEVIPEQQASAASEQVEPEKMEVVSEIVPEAIPEVVPEKAAEEVKEVPVVVEGPKDASEELSAQMEALTLKEESSPFSERLNSEILTMIHQTSKEMQLKFSNPIRDYNHLLSNRLIILLVELQNNFSEAVKIHD